jgi:hypothetical protein
MNLQILKHNPPKDKSPYKISLLQKIYCEKKEYTKTKQKTTTAIARKRNQPSPESARTTHTPSPKTPSSIQPPQTTISIHKPGLRSEAQPSRADPGSKFPHVYRPRAGQGIETQP